MVPGDVLFYLLLLCVVQVGGAIAAVVANNAQLFQTSQPVKPEFAILYNPLSYLRCVTGDKERQKRKT